MDAGPVGGPANHGYDKCHSLQLQVNGTHFEAQNTLRYITIKTI